MGGFGGGTRVAFLPRDVRVYGVHPFRTGIEPHLIEIRRTFQMVNTVEARERLKSRRPKRNL